MPAMIGRTWPARTGGASVRFLRLLRDEPVQLWWQPVGRVIFQASSGVEDSVRLVRRSLINAMADPVQTELDSP